MSEKIISGFLFLCVGQLSDMNPSAHRVAWVVFGSYFPQFFFGKYFKYLVLVTPRSIFFFHMLVGR